MRPWTLAEVAERAAAGDSFGRSLSNFLDDFYAGPTWDALADGPRLLAPLRGRLGQVEDAYLDATAMELARRCGLTVGAWACDEVRYLRRPWFASPMASLRAVLIHESPSAFRSRNVFVSDNALTRA